MKPNILIFAGSLRKGSYNKMLARIAARSVEKHGGTPVLIELNQFPMPLYDGDLESSSGIPEPARRFKELMIQSDGYIICSPEYNSSIPGILKNALDWASRSEPGEKDLLAFKGKTAAILSASPGALGGLRGLVHLRAMLTNIGVLLIPDQQAVSRAGDAFDSDGNLKDPKISEKVDQIISKLVGVIQKLSA